MEEQKLEYLNTDPSLVRINVKSVSSKLRIPATYSDNENIKKLSKLRDVSIGNLEKAFEDCGMKDIISVRLRDYIRDFHLWSSTEEDWKHYQSFCPTREQYDNALALANTSEENLYQLSPSTLAKVLETIRSYRDLEYMSKIRERTRKQGVISKKFKSFKKFTEAMANEFKLVNGDERLLGMTQDDFRGIVEKLATVFSYVDLTSTR